jgi:tetratricopeptide (TPR) repeat protein
MKRRFNIINRVLTWNPFSKSRREKTVSENHTIPLDVSNKQIFKNNNLNDIGKFLPDNELRILADKANDCLQNHDYEETINLYTRIIDSSFSDSRYKAYYLSSRRSLFSSLKKWDLAIEDNKRLIELYPDIPENYLSMGAIITLKFFYSGYYRINGDNNILEEAIYYYNECLRRNPVSPSTWLNIMETYIHLMKWDDAISHYGTCKTYMNNEYYKLVHAWLGGLALALAGEDIDEEDIRPLLDNRPKIDSDWDSNQIKDVFKELEKIQFDKDRIHKAETINELFEARIKSSDFSEPYK